MAQLRVVDMVELARSAPPATHWAIRDVLPAASKALLAAEHKSFKSTVALDLAYSVANGTDFLGRYEVETPGPVIYIDAELREIDLRLWCRRLMAARGHRRLLRHDIDPADVVPHNLFFVRSDGDAAVNLRHEKCKKALSRFCAEKEPALVVCDPFYELSGFANASRAEEVQQVLSWLTSVRESTGASVMMLHHERKPTTDKDGKEVDTGRRSHKILGSQAFSAWWEAYWSLRRPDENEPVVEWGRQFRAAPSSPVAQLRFELGEMTEAMEDEDLIPSYGVEVTEASSPKELDGRLGEEKVLDALAEHVRLKENELPRLTGLPEGRLRRQALPSLEGRGLIRRFPSRGNVAAEVELVEADGETVIAFDLTGFRKRLGR